MVIRTAAPTKVHAGTPVVDGLDLEVKPGEIYGFLAPTEPASPPTGMHIVFVAGSRDTVDASVRLRWRLGPVPARSTVMERVPRLLGFGMATATAAEIQLRVQGRLGSAVAACRR